MRVKKKRGQETEPALSIAKRFAYCGGQEPVAGAIKTTYAASHTSCGSRLVTVVRFSTGFEQPDAFA